MKTLPPAQSSWRQEKQVWKRGEAQRWRLSGEAMEGGRLG